MKKYGPLAGLTLFFLLFAPPMAAGEEEEKSATFELAGSLFAPRLVFSFTSDGGEWRDPEDLDFKNLLGLKESIGGRLAVTWFTGPQSRLRLAYGLMPIHGDVRAHRDAFWRGEPIKQSRRVITDLFLETYTFSWFWSWLEAADGRFTGGTALEVTTLHVDWRIRIEEEYEDLSLAFWFPLPTFGVIAGYQLANGIQLYGEVSALPLADIGYLLRGEMGGEWGKDQFGLKAGLRIFKFLVDDETERFEFSLLGPFIEAGFRI